LGRGGSSTVYRITDSKGNLFALKKVELRSHDHEAYCSFVNEIALLERLRGQDRIIQLMESEVNESKKLLLMVSGIVSLLFLAMNLTDNWMRTSRSWRWERLI
jgi:serine/threonine-protein kinase TTK/MPS1